MYLEYFSKNLSVTENIHEVLFSESAPLKNEYQNLYAALFDKYEEYVKIVEALSKSKKGLPRKEIVYETKISNGGTLTMMINDLIESDFVDNYSAYGKRKKESIFRLKDFFSLFYHRFIIRKSIDPTFRFAQLMDTPSYHTFQGYAFENLCFHHLLKIKKVLGISAVGTKISTYESKANDDVPGTQIDLIIERQDNCLHIIEAKFSQSIFVITKKYAEELQKKAVIFRHNTGYRHQIFYTLITSKGVLQNKYSNELIDQVITIEQLID